MIEKVPESRKARKVHYTLLEANENGDIPPENQRESNFKYIVETDNKAWNACSLFVRVASILSFTNAGCSCTSSCVAANSKQMESVCKEQINVSSVHLGTLQVCIIPSQSYSLLAVFSLFTGS